MISPIVAAVLAASWLQTPLPPASQPPRLILTAGSAQAAPRAVQGAPEGQDQVQKPGEQPDQEKKDRDRNRGVRLVWSDRPSLRVGDLLRVDLRVKLQADLRTSSMDLSDHGGTFDLNRRRVGIRGSFLKLFEYEVEREVNVETNPWRDVYVDFQPHTAFRLQAGKFKMPFSLDQLTGPTDLDFVYRSLAARRLAPGRDVGAMAHGRLFGRVLTYEAGYFRSDGDNVPEPSPLDPAYGEVAPFDARSLAGRVTVSPFGESRGNLLRHLTVGAAITSSQVQEGFNNSRGETALGYNFFPHVYVSGPRRRTGVEVAWLPGPFSLKAEYIELREARERQGVGDETNPDIIGTGWYVSGTWALTGESKAGGIQPRRGLLRGGFGSVEVGVRYDTLWFGSGPNAGPPIRHERAERLLRNADEAWTIGVSWYVDRWFKIQVNGIRETITTTEPGPTTLNGSYWSTVCRLQFVM